MQSMHLFLKEKNLKMGIRTSLENFSVYDKINVVPLYAIGNVRVIFLYEFFYYIRKIYIKISTIMEKLIQKFPIYQKNLYKKFGYIGKN